MQKWLKDRKGDNLSVDEINEYACELAESLNIKNLLLYHTEDRNLSERKKLYCEEGYAYYKGNLLVPNDLEIIEIG